MDKAKTIVERWATDSIPTSAVSQCSLCKHKHLGDTCDAFPNGIPLEFEDNIIIHNISVEGDGGIIYSPIKDEYAEIEFKPFGKKTLY